MKLVTRFLSLLVLACLATFYISCDKGGGENETEEQKQLKKLSSSWTLTSAKLDNVDRTADFPNLVLTLSGTFAQGGTYNYSFTGTRPNPSPWPQSGIWSFGSPVTSVIDRDPETVSETPLGYSLSSDGTQLSIEFEVQPGSTGWAGGTSRIEAVSGLWTFDFTKQ